MASPLLEHADASISLLSIVNLRQDLTGAAGGEARHARLVLRAMSRSWRSSAARLAHCVPATAVLFGLYEHQSAWSLADTTASPPNRRHLGRPLTGPGQDQLASGR